MGHIFSYNYIRDFVQFYILVGRRGYCGGVSWFWVSTQIIMPYFQGQAIVFCLFYFSSFSFRSFPNFQNRRHCVGHLTTWKSCCCFGRFFAKKLNINCKKKKSNILFDLLKVLCSVLDTLKNPYEQSKFSEKKPTRSSAHRTGQFKYTGLESLDTKPVFASSRDNAKTCFGIVRMQKPCLYPTIPNRCI